MESIPDLAPDPETRDVLLRAARTFGTPSYVHLVDDVVRTIERVRAALLGRFEISYAVKCNPNLGLLEALRDTLDGLDVSSAGEIDRGIAAGYDPARFSFSGPAKRSDELIRALETGCGDVVCESEWELGQLDRLAAERGARARVLLRINPRTVPKRFRMPMAGRPTQFGIDEEEVDGVLSRRARFAHLDVCGFHVYSASNSTSDEGLAENFGIMCELFERFSAAHELAPDKLIFGAGFGIPYQSDQAPLDLDALCARINERVGAMLARPELAGARCVLELGRYLVGPSGYFLTSVLNEKSSRGAEIRMCDGGLHQHVTACGLMGAVIRRNYPMWSLTSDADDGEHEYMLTGPLCTTLDTLATSIRLPRLERGSVLAIGSSGAYGLTLSPATFISHPRPAEVLVHGRGAEARLEDVSGR
jgi:diaminopimelate decarboxylase